MRDMVVTKDVVDGAAGAIAVSTWMGYLPEIAAGLAIIWTLIRIYEWAEARFLKKKPINLENL